MYRSRNMMKCDAKKQRVSQLTRKKSNLKPETTLFCVRLRIQTDSNSSFWPSGVLCEAEVEP